MKKFRRRSHKKKVYRRRSAKKMFKRSLRKKNMTGYDGMYMAKCATLHDVTSGAGSFDLITVSWGTPVIIAGMTSRL